MKAPVRVTVTGAAGQIGYKTITFAPRAHSTPGMAAGVIGALQRPAGNTQPVALCVTSRSDHCCDSRLKDARGQPAA